MLWQQSEKYDWRGSFFTDGHIQNAGTLDNDFTHPLQSKVDFVAIALQVWQMKFTAFSPSLHFEKRWGGT